MLTHVLIKQARMSDTTRVSFFRVESHAYVFVCKHVDPCLQTLQALLTTLSAATLVASLLAGSLRLDALSMVWQLIHQLGCLIFLLGVLLAGTKWNAWLGFHLHARWLLDCILMYVRIWGLTHMRADITSVCHRWSSNGGSRFTASRA